MEKEITNKELLIAIQGTRSSSDKFQKSQEVTNKELLEKIDQSIQVSDKRFDKLDGMFKEIKESNNEILEAIGNYSNEVEGRFNGIDGRFNAIDEKLTDIEATLNTQVVKKSDLDDKFKEYFGENVVAPAKALNYKTNKIATILEDKKIINSKEADSIRSMEIFPKPVSN